MAQQEGRYRRVEVSFLLICINFIVFRLKNVESSSKKRLPGGGRHLRDEEFDENMANWVRDQRSKKLKVSRRLIHLEAIRRFDAYCSEDEDQPAFKVFI
jgi:hypothetical protein